MDRTPTRLSRPSGAVLVLVAALAGACATAPPEQPPQQEQLAQAVAAPDRLEPPEDLPGEARALLQTRMAAHARAMGDLVSAIMILKYPVIAARATDIAEEVHFARPLTGDASLLNSALPEAFFQHDEDLRRTARELATAAEKVDALAVADAYGRLSKTCVSCHATYRAGR